MNVQKKIKIFLFWMPLALASCALTSRITDKFLPDSEFKTLVVKADLAMSEAEFAKASELYTKAVSIKPDDLNIRLKQAKAYENNGNLALAYNTYQLIIDAKSDSDEINNNIKKTAVQNQKNLGFKPPLIDDSQNLSVKDSTLKAAPTTELIEPLKPIKSNVESTFQPDSQAIQEPSNLQPFESHPSPMIIQSKAVMTSVAGWSDAWMNKNLELYFSYYANDFAGQFADSKTWRESRKSKILNNKPIKIDLSDVQFVNHNEETVEVSFIQNYQSGGYKDSGRKVLHMKRIKGRWLITKEIFN